MKIEHLAIWVNDIQLMKAFYEKYFRGIAGDKYHNRTKNFESYFITFEKNGCRLELMKRPDIPENKNNVFDEYRGLIHFAISVGSRENVDYLTDQLRADGYKIVGEPRTTGDGYYESVVLDPEMNRIEITI